MFLDKLQYAFVPDSFFLWWGYYIVDIIGFNRLKFNMVSPFAMHQQLAMLAQQQSLLMAAVAKSAPGNTQQPPSNGTSIPTQTWSNIGFQIPGMMMPVAEQTVLQKLMQVDSIVESNPWNDDSCFCGLGSFWIEFCSETCFDKIILTFSGKNYPTFLCQFLKMLLLSPRFRRFICRSW